MVELLPESGGNLLALKAIDKLTDRDYEELLIPRLEEIIREYGKARFLLEMGTDFHGWEAGAVWDDAKFGLTHRNDFERIAVVGAPHWVEWGLKLGGMIMSAGIGCFPAEAHAAAMQWVRGLTSEKQQGGLQTVAIRCPYCDNHNDVQVAPTAEEQQIIQSCQVCRQSMVIRVSHDTAGELLAIAETEES